MKENPQTISELHEGFTMAKWGQKELTEIYSFTNVFTRDEINIIKKYCEQIEPADAQIGADYDEYTVAESVRSSVVRWIPINEDTKFIYDRLYDIVNIANDEMWGFDLTGFYEAAQYTEYYGTDEGHYDWHLDIGQEVDYRKISVTIQLSEPEEYEGGELQMLLGPNISNAGKEMGLATVFPSYMLHRVSNVTSGVRKSLVIWVTGPSFR